MSTVTVRPATENDLSEMLAIYNDAVIHTIASWDYEPQTLQARRDWFLARQAAGLPVFVAEAAGAIAGFSTYGQFRDRIGYRFTVENSVYVAASQRGRGVGKALMLPLITAARAQHLQTIVAGIAIPNDASLQLHRSLGFEQVAHLKRVGYKFGQWLDLLFLQLML